MKTKILIFAIVCLTFIMSCEEKDAPVLIGDIRGTVTMIDGYGFNLADQSGVQVLLIGKNTELETTTDTDGNYLFEDLPFGNYHISLTRENFVERKLNYSVGHVGGEVPTTIVQEMNEIPEYHYAIDSLVYNGHSYLNIYFKTIGATRSLASKNFLGHVFFSHSPEVSYENYEYSFIDFIFDNAIYWTFWNGIYNFMPDLDGTVYCRIYPQVWCDDIWYDNTEGPHVIYPETLGEPSPVFSFNVEAITRPPQNF